jgi:DNA-directed RNA polymerase specialized sigma24 family protein
MNENPVLDAIIARETYTELLAELRPRELSVVALRLDGLPFDVAAELIGISRQAVYQRLAPARNRLKSRFPHIQTLLEGDP